MERPLCAYCGLVEGRSRDHVPPKSLFRKPRPAMVTAPQCDDCRRGTSADDEHLRAYLTARQDAAAKRVGRKKAAFAGFAAGDGFYLGWIKRARRAEEARAAVGVVRPKMHSLPETEPLGRVVRRIVRGLHYRKFAERLTRDRVIDVLADEDFDPAYGALGAKYAEMLDLFGRTPLEVIQHDVFGYRRLDVVGGPYEAGWQLVFLREAWFVALVRRR